MFRIFFTFFKVIFLFFLVCSVRAHQSSHADISLNWENVNLVEALHYVGNIVHENVLIDQSIEGSVTFEVKHMQAKKVFELLLSSHQLICVLMNNTWFITLQQKWEQNKQNQYKIRESLIAVAPLHSQSWQLHYAKATDVMHVLQRNGNSMLSKRGHLYVDPRTNVLFVQDIQAQLVLINTAIQKMDVPLQQILIETYLASVDSDYEKNLGIDFTVQPSIGVNNISPSKYSLVVATLADSNMLNIRLSALEDSGHAELVSNPRLFTASQQTAMIESGEEIPYQEESASGGTVVVFKKAVLSLKVTPQLLPHHQVLLQIHLNQDKPSKLIVHGVPAINTRQLITSVLAQNGQTVVLGGIYETDQVWAKESIPILSDIPLLGKLFQQNDHSRKKRELLIFVTPKVMS